MITQDMHDNKKLEVTGKIMKFSLSDAIFFCYSAQDQLLDSFLCSVQSVVFSVLAEGCIVNFSQGLVDNF